jgi:hypothetical protein
MKINVRALLRMSSACALLTALSACGPEGVVGDDAQSITVSGADGASLSYVPTGPCDWCPSFECALVTYRVGVPVHALGDGFCRRRSTGSL